MSSKSISSTATARLKQDYMRLLRDPVPYVKATPLANNILTWHYVVKGPEDTPFDGGFYHGKLVFPREYPFKPPAIYMITPNGRFKVNQKLCLSISDFHPDTWNPAWSVSTILTGLLSFMVENTPTSGSIESSDGTKRRIAQETKEFNLKDKIFCECFPEIAEELKESFIKKKKLEEEKAELQLKETQKGVQDINVNNEGDSNHAQNWQMSILNNMFVMIALAAFAFVVKHVFNTMN